MIGQVVKKQRKEMETD